MQLNSLFGILTLMMGIGLPELLILVIIFYLPSFFLFRKLYRKKFGNEQSKVLGWSIVTSFFASTVLVVALFAVLTMWLMELESRG